MSITVSAETAAMVREGLDPLNDYLRICEALDDAARRLDPVSDSARLDAELLLARALDVRRSYLFAHPEDCMDADAAGRFETAVLQRVGGMPMAYITGRKEFWSMPLIVSPATLVPRPETETLVEQALVRIPRKAEWAIVDLGTGSGAIALAIARERPLCTVTGTDSADDALVVAAENARQLSVPNVEFLAGNWTEPIAGRRFDMLISNPPYVASGDPHLAALRFEPRAALEAGADGLDAIREIAAGAFDVVRPGGTLILEHGYQQAGGVAQILTDAGWTDIALATDIEGRPRVTAAERP